MFEEFSSEEFREHRHVIFATEIPTNVDLNTISRDLIRSAQMVLVAMNRIGFLVNKGLIPMDKDLANFLRPPTIKLWEKLIPLVERERDRRGESNWMFFFNGLTGRCKNYLPEYLPYDPEYLPYYWEDIIGERDG